MQRYRFAKKRKLDDDKELPFKDSGLADKNSAVVYQSSDLVLKQGEILDRYGDLILRSSPYLNTDMKNHEIIERHLVVLFGLIRAFKIVSHVAWFWSTVSRYWLNIRISSQDQNQRTKDLVEAVVRARGHDGFYYNPTSLAPAAKTHLGKLVDNWARHQGDKRHAFFADNPTLTTEQNKEFKEVQNIVALATKKRPLGVFAHHDYHEVTGWPQAAPARGAPARGAPARGAPARGAPARRGVPARDVPFDAPASPEDDELSPNGNDHDSEIDNEDDNQDPNMDSIKAMSRELAAGRIAAQTEAIRLYEGQVKCSHEHAKLSQEHSKLSREHSKLSREHAKLSQEQSSLVQQLAAETQQLVKNAQQLDAITKKVDANAQKLDKNAQELDKNTKKLNKNAEKLEEFAKQQGVFITMLLDIAKKQNRLESQISSLKEEQK
ncbi:hypothetical protein PG984_006123 [Apiospora sp. TS-2023a]